LLFYQVSRFIRIGQKKGSHPNRESGREGLP